MIWRRDDRDRIGFVCDNPQCRRTLTPPIDGIYGAFLHARDNGWHAALNQQFCPDHAKAKTRA